MPKTDPNSPIVCPWTPIVDGREKLAYQFANLRADANKNHRPIVVQWEWGHLKSGDYSIKGYETQAAIERKSLEDLYSTLGQHRDRFEAEHQRLAEMELALVVIEADWPTILRSPPERSKLCPKTISRTAISWHQKYGVAWLALSSRGLAEAWTFRTLDTFWRHKQEAA